MSIFRKKPGPVEEKPAPAAACGCPTNSAGDIRCHRCRQRVNVRCWNCGTPRGEGLCPNPRATGAEHG